MKTTMGFFSLALLVATGAHAFPWKAGDTPPVIDGLALGDTEAQVHKLLGPPANVSQMGPGHVLEYPDKGLEVIATQDDGVSIIRLREAGAGAIGGIRIGDDLAAMSAKWGSPAVHKGLVSIYDAGVWSVEVRVATADSTTITDMLLAWNQTKWAPPPPGTKTQFYRPK
jgi:hypothetical protein